jgi:Delta7-sterol 5-desaturase
MDLILSFADDYLLDDAWAHLVPASAFTPSQSSFFTPPLIAFPQISPWHHFLLTLLPRPPLNSTQHSSILIPVSAWPRDYIPRQLVSLSVITLIGIFFVYFISAGLSYFFIFNHDLMKHPRFLKHQVKLEIQCSLRAFPGMTLLTLPWFEAEVRGYSMLYDNVDDYGLLYLFLSVPL